MGLIFYLEEEIVAEILIEIIGHFNRNLVPLSVLEFPAVEGVEIFRVGHSAAPFELLVTGRSPRVFHQLVNGSDQHEVLRMGFGVAQLPSRSQEPEHHVGNVL